MNIPFYITFLISFTLTVIIIICSYFYRRKKKSMNKEIKYSEIPPHIYPNSSIISVTKKGLTDEEIYDMIHRPIKLELYPLFKPNYIKEDINISRSNHRRAIIKTPIGVTVNLRSTPTDRWIGNTNIIASLYSGEVVYVMDTMIDKRDIDIKPWYQVQTSHGVGYINASYVQYVQLETIKRIPRREFGYFLSGITGYTPNESISNEAAFMSGYGIGGYGNRQVVSFLTIKTQPPE